MKWASVVVYTFTFNLTGANFLPVITLKMQIYSVFIIIAARYLDVFVGELVRGWVAGWLMSPSFITCLIVAFSLSSSARWLTVSDQRLMYKK